MPENTQFTRARALDQSPTRMPLLTAPPPLTTLKTHITRTAGSAPRGVRLGIADRAAILARIGLRLLAMAAAIWHNTKTGAPSKRSLIAYDH
jgi:hypothetical protein